MKDPLRTRLSLRPSGVGARPEYLALLGSVNFWNNSGVIFSELWPIWSTTGTDGDLCERRFCFLNIPPPNRFETPCHAGMQSVDHEEMPARPLCGFPTHSEKATFARAGMSTYS